MVCLRCRMIVDSQLNNLSITHRPAELGEVELLETIRPEQLSVFGEQIALFGLQLMDDKKRVIIEKIKEIILGLIHDSKDPLSINVSHWLSQQVGHDYTYLAKIFSDIQGITIEKFIITHRIERVKELLVYADLTLTEIAWKMHYSSVAHLSNQFKKITSLTPSQFRVVHGIRRSRVTDHEM